MGVKSTLRPWCLINTAHPTHPHSHSGLKNIFSTRWQQHFGTKGGRVDRPNSYQWSGTSTWRRLSILADKMIRRCLAHPLLCAVQTDPSSPVSPRVNDQLCSLKYQYTDLKSERAGSGWRVSQGRVLFVILHLVMELSFEILCGCI